MLKDVILGFLLAILSLAALHTPTQAQVKPRDTGLSCGEMFNIECHTFRQRCTDLDYANKIQLTIHSKVNKKGGIYTITYSWNNTLAQSEELYIEIMLPYSLPIMDTLTSTPQITLRNSSLTPQTVRVKVIIYGDTLRPICTSIVEIQDFVLTQ
jgi:hypothetical protein